MSAEKPRERPILFNDQMVRAILDGRKTVTRRVMKPQPMPSKSGGHHWPCKVHQSMLHVERELQNGEGCWCGLAEAACPYGQPGDRLWVREAWGLQVRSYGGGAGEFIVYRATNPDAIYCRSSEGREYPVKWKPSIHMGRHSSRILLEITAVRVERLHDLSDPGALAEGVSHSEMHSGDSLVDVFARLWKSIGGDWDANPWVWVVEFKRVTP
ncbi:TPA: hypothetical protein OUI23_001330 [Pseudomonas aeruginosa]|nr:hypothetical protein [Pseudomonas aeruginosa]